MGTSEHLLLSTDELNLALGYLVEARWLQDQAQDDVIFNRIDKDLRTAIDEIKKTGDTSVEIPGCYKTKSELMLSGSKCEEFTQNGSDCTISSFPSVAEKYGTDVMVTVFSTEFPHKNRRQPFEDIVIYSFAKPIYDEDGDFEDSECLGFILDF